MDYLRSLKKPAMEEGTRREVESAHTVESFNSVEEQEDAGTGRRVPKREYKASEQGASGSTLRGLICEEGLKSSSVTGSNTEVVHIVPSVVGTSQPCKLPQKVPKENCSEDRFNPGSRQTLECRNLSCDCKTVTC